MTYLLKQLRNSMHRGTSPEFIRISIGGFFSRLNVFLAAWVAKNWRFSSELCIPVKINKMIHWANSIYSERIPQRKENRMVIKKKVPAVISSIVVGTWALLSCNGLVGSSLKDMFLLFNNCSSFFIFLNSTLTSFRRLRIS